MRRFQSGSTANHCTNISYIPYPVKDRTEESLEDGGTTKRLRTRQALRSWAGSSPGWAAFAMFLFWMMFRDRAGEKALNW